jgi:hypothetical protein
MARVRGVDHFNRAVLVFKPQADIVLFYRKRVDWGRERGIRYHPHQVNSWQRFAGATHLSGGMLNFADIRDLVRRLYVPILQGRWL